jgi:hypothetical protein
MKGGKTLVAASLVGVVMPNTLLMYSKSAGGYVLGSAGAVGFGGALGAIDRGFDHALYVGAEEAAVASGRVTDKYEGANA